MYDGYIKITVFVWLCVVKLKILFWCGYVDFGKNDFSWQSAGMFLSP